MRARNLKPNFFKNEDLAECSPLARILFAGLWCYADRDGRFEWRPKRIKVEILPYEKCNVMSLLAELEQKHFILRYNVNGDSFAYIPTFLKHQNPHPHEKKSDIPRPSEDVIKCNDMQLQDIKCTASSLNPSSLNHESLISSKVFPLDACCLCCLLLEYLEERNPKMKNPNFKVWIKDMDLMLRRDNREHREAARVIMWCQEDNFWQVNIRSPAKLRVQYDQLFEKMNHKMETHDDAERRRFHQLIHDAAE